MSRATPARRRALALVSVRRRRGARARDLLRSCEGLDALAPRDRALCTRLVLGATAARGELDRVLGSHLSPGARLEPRVRDALQLAAFELLYLDTRDDVCVSQGVELVRGVAPRAAGLANAVLRRVAQQDAPALARARGRVADGTADVADLARVGALPEWLCGRLVASLGPEGAAHLCASALGPCGAYVAANRARTSAARARELLAQAGCDPRDAGLPGAFELGEPSRLAPSGLVGSVDVLPCDLAAQRVAHALGCRPGERVLEVGQGRATKTLLMEGCACAAGGPCEVVGVELDPSKSDLAARRVRDAGLAGHVRCVAMDARGLAAPDALPDAPEGGFDLVFVDAPCTGTGTLARHPEIAWSLSPEDPQRLAALQLEVLRAAASRVRPGGRLAYATCSVLDEEDRQVIDALLAGPVGEGLELVGEGIVCAPRGDSHYLATLRRR